jgi:hypothetical protein
MAPTSQRIAVLIVLLLLLLPPALAAQPPATKLRGIEALGAGAVETKTGQHCHAFAPADWSISGNSPQGDVFELARADRRMYAGWGIRGVNRSMERYYGALYADPETSSLFLVAATIKGLGGNDGVRYEGPVVPLGAGFVMRRFASPTHRGLIAYRTYPPPFGLGPGSYIISLRIALSDRQEWDRGGQTIATAVAVSIECTTMFRPPAPGDLPRPRPGDVGRKKPKSETNELEGYNVQLGIQYVHAADGTLYRMDASSDYRETGPDGPGYYRRQSTGWEKLIPGVP